MGKFIFQIADSVSETFAFLYEFYFDKSDRTFVQNKVFNISNPQRVDHLRKPRILSPLRSLRT